MGVNGVLYSGSRRFFLKRDSVLETQRFDGEGDRKSLYHRQVVLPSLGMLVVNQREGRHCSWEGYVSLMAAATSKEASGPSEVGMLWTKKLV